MSFEAKTRQTLVNGTDMKVVVAKYRQYRPECEHMYSLQCQEVA